MAARKHFFAKGKGDLGRTNIVQHQIHTGDQPAIKQRVRRYPAARREEEWQLVEDMLAIGIIQESNSAWSSPTVLVKKKDGTTRFCIDYRRLNQVTKVDAYPLPHIEDSLNTLGGARFFCSLDLASGYWQVEMDAADREKTAFVTQGGLYVFRVMPFGLVNAPATFERLLERVLRGIAWSECLVYLDDILVFGPDFGTTLARLESVRAGLDPRGDGSQARRLPRHRSHHEMEAGRERPAPLGGHLARVTRSQGTMAPVGTVVPGRRGATPTVPRVGGTGMEAPLSRPFSSGSMEG